VTSAPQKIDGARLLQIADVRDAAPTGRTRHFTRRGVVSGIAWLALAKYEDDPGVYVFYCDGGWNLMTDTCHESVEQAIAHAEFELDPVEFRPLPD
jgi:hypothetical protein